MLSTASIYREYLAQLVKCRRQHATLTCRDRDHGHGHGPYLDHVPFHATCFDVFADPFHGLGLGHDHVLCHDHGHDLFHDRARAPVPCSDLDPDLCLCRGHDRGHDPCEEARV